MACREADDAIALASRIAAASRGAVSAASTAMRTLVREAAMLQPDVLLVEHEKKDDERLWAAIEHVARASAHTRVVLLCEPYSHLELAEFVRRGVSGCVLASGSADYWATAVQAVARGEPWFRRTALLRALRMKMGSAPLPPALASIDESSLTTREHEILELVRSGLTNKEVGQRLEISDKTVKTHMHNIYVKLHQSGRYQILLAHGPQQPA